MKRIEQLIRSTDWSRATRVEFFAHLDKRIRDDTRAGYCARKASFMLRAPGKRHATWALELVAFALMTFPDVSKDVRASLLAERANALDALGDEKSADAAYRAARKLDPNLA